MKRQNCLILLALPFSVSAQSLIVGIPSADITPKKELILAHESQYNRFASGNYWNSFTFATYGIGHNTELATSVYGVSSPASNNSSIGFGLKHMVPLRWKKAQRWEPRLTGGFMVPVSFEGQGVGYWFYGNGSFRIPQTKTRITAGPSIGTKQIFGRRAYSTMVGVEHPLSRRWSIVSDWFSGTNDLGAGIFAFAWQRDPKLLIIFGYKVANNAQSGKNAFMIEVTRAFGGEH
jgi:hypothetical protein